MDQQYSIDDQDQERHFIGNLLSDDEASAARSESSSRSSHKLSSLPSFENITSNANAIGPSPNQAFWPEPPPPYSPPLSDTFAKWELEAAATGDVFNTFGCGKDKALFPGINSNSSYNPVYTSFTNDLVEDFYSELIKPFEGMPSRVQSKPPPPPSFNQIQQLNAKKALADKKKGRFLQKNMPPSDTELLKRKAEFSSDDLRDPNSFPCLYRQMSEHLPSATTQTSTGILPAGKSYRDVLSTKSTPPQHKPISGVLSAPGNNPKIPTAPILPPHGYSSKVARATSPPMGISSVKKGQSQKGLLPLSIGGVAKLGKNSTVTSVPPATDGLDMGEKAGVEKRAEKQRTIVGLNPIDSQNGNKFGDKSNAKESDSFQKIDRKKKVTKISSNQTSPPQSKSSILAALEIANGKPKNSSGKTTSISKLSEKVKEDQKKSQAFDEQEFEPILTRKNVMKNDVDERMDSDDETFENHTETSDDEDDDVFYAQQNYRLKQKARRGTDPEPKRLLSSSENMPARKKKNKQQHPLPIVYLIMFLTLVWEALVKFGTWIVNLIVDVACLSYWAIVEAATATAWKIVLVYRSCVHAISAFFKNIFLGLWNALKAGIRLTNGCSSEDQFLVGLEENIVLPTCCEEVGHYYDTKICLTRGVQQ
uniref:Uncharacterized protein n=1 Tax=Acrobeloides nanus TaxID=290746 RepID=A0A914CNX3_9BILA